MRKSWIMFSIVLVIVISPLAGVCAGADLSNADSRPRNCADDPACRRASWKEEFERICIQTEIATSLTAGQLQKLISDSDELLSRLKRLQNPQAKIYIFRLRNCREFFVYALQLKQPGERL